MVLAALFFGASRCRHRIGIYDSDGGHPLLLVV